MRPSSSVDIVGEYRWRLYAGYHLQAEGQGAPLLCTLKGTPTDPSYARHLLPRLAKRAGLERRVHPHELRHTHAADLALAGAPIFAIQQQLGHTSGWRPPGRTPRRDLHQQGGHSRPERRAPYSSGRGKTSGSQSSVGNGEHELSRHKKPHPHSGSAWHGDWHRASMKPGALPDTSQTSSPTHASASVQPYEQCTPPHTMNAGSPQPSVIRGSSGASMSWW
ncbi:MAG: tyrosine-type recombinase/integrase [Nannocystales bacterium]